MSVVCTFARYLLRTDSTDLIISGFISPGFFDIIDV